MNALGRELSITALVVLLASLAVPAASGQPVLDSKDVERAVQAAQQEKKLAQVLTDKAGYAAAIVLKWEDSARAKGRWDVHYAQDLFGALMKLQSDNLIAAGDAPSYEAMMTVLMTGTQKQSVVTKSLGDFSDDLVYTPITPCRIVDTRNAGGTIPAGGMRNFDVDGSNFTSQGGSSTGCGIPLAVASAVEMSIAVTQPNAAGFFRAWSVDQSQPSTSILNFIAGQTIATNAIIPVSPGSGGDFTLLSAGATAHAVIDVLGYFAAPVATALSCQSVGSAVTAIPVNAWTSLDATCPAGFSATGGGFFSTEGSLGYPGVWVLSMPNGATSWRTWVDNQTSGSRNMQTWVQCCRVPGR